MREWFNDLFENIGEKIKNMAKRTCAFCLIVYSIVGAYALFWAFFDEGSIVIAFEVIIGYLLLCSSSIISAMFLYAFGTLVNNSENSANLREIEFGIRKLVIFSNKFEATIIKQETEQREKEKHKEDMLETPPKVNVSQVCLEKETVTDKCLDEEVACPNCKEWLHHMGYTKDDFNVGIKCPICGVEL